VGTLRESALDLAFQPEAVTLPALTTAETAHMEFATTGLSTGLHPMAFYRETLDEVLTSDALREQPQGARVWTAGLLVVHQAPPTAKGHRFLTLEDEYGFINIVVRPRIYVLYRRVIRGASILLVWGEVQRQGEVVNVVAARVERL
jgi:error-prone DNA polymerase